MSVRRAIERFRLKVRGFNLDEMEEEWRQMDRAKQNREREREEAERRAREAHEETIRLTRMLEGMTDMYSYGRTNDDE